MIKKLIFVFIFCLMSVTGWTLDFPALTGRVVDEAGILSFATRKNIEGVISPDQRFVVVTLQSLRGQSIENYGLALGNHWQIGSRQKNDGLLLVVAPNERKVRIEVGSGLENIITNSKAEYVIEHVILPEFKKGDYNTGILKGVQVLQGVLSGQPVNAEPKNPIYTVWGIAVFLGLCQLFAFSFLWKIYKEVQNRSLTRDRTEKYKWNLLSYLVLFILCVHIVMVGMLFYNHFQKNVFVNVWEIASVIVVFVYGTIWQILAPKSIKGSSGYKQDSLLKTVLLGLLGCMAVSNRRRRRRGLFGSFDSYLDEDDDVLFSSRRRSSSSYSSSSHSRGGSFRGGGSSGSW